MTLPKMDSTRIGLDYIVENREYVGKLGTALDTNNATVKKQVFELLSALCAYSADGHARALETLEHYKILKNDRYRLKLIVAELEKSSSIEYQVALLAFINCVIISATSLQDRIRLRNEFIGLNLLPVLSNLRRISGSIADIAVQLDVFDEQRECDEAQSLQGPDGINLNSHLDVFYAILRQVADTPQEIPFLSILQHLLRIDSKEPISDIIWDATETLVHRATLLENREDSARLLRAPSVQKFTCPHCRGEASSPSRKPSLIPTIPPQPIQISAQLQNCCVDTTTLSAPPPPPPPLPPPQASQSFCIPPPPPPQMPGGNSPQAPPAPPPPAPSLLAASKNGNKLTAGSAGGSSRPITPDPLGDPDKLLPQQETPLPKAKMKTINWNKIPANKVVGKHNIWTIVANSHQDSPMEDLDWGEMEGLFCQQATNTQGSPKLGANRDGVDNAERKARKENSEIILLDGKRSLNVNIFLKQFRTSNDEIIQLIKDGEHDDIGAEKLRGFLKILPEVDELDMLKNFDGDINRLGNAEKFLLQLLQVSNYKLRIESMLLKEEFAANMSYLEPCINAMLFAGEDLTTNTMLREVLYMVVVAGNFLNAGGYAGNAVGVKLSSLQKLTDIRANKPGMNLIHYVAMQAEKKNRELLAFPQKLTTLENASRTTADQINNEINALDTRIQKIKKQIELPTTEQDIKEQMTEFLGVAEREVGMLQNGMKEVESLRLQLAEFFCEDPASFKLEECFKIFQNFCEKFKQAVNENERRRIQEEQATIRRKQREEQLAKRARQTSQAGTPVSDSESNLLLDPTFDLRGSPAMSRRRIGSFNSNGDPSIFRDDTASPDITPTGSLRRRRSRVLSEEDDGSLMDFLRSSGHDNGSRERKPSSYGSLDRSWARRARTGSSNKKRPDLLNIDFGTDRERPNSPSPLAEQKPLPAEENKPREWRQKIESWLQANEQDEKQNEDYRRRARRLAVNRKSFENDSESERSKLDPLPEEKISTTTNDTYKRVYPDWKPSTTLEKADVVGTIEAIEDATAPTTRTRDKSAWRKSNLNVPNSSEDTESYSRRLMRQRSREGLATQTSPLHSIIEEDRRKSVIQQLGDRSASDRLQIYIRRPSDSPDVTNDVITSPINITAMSTADAPVTSDHHSIYIRPSNDNTNIPSGVSNTPNVPRRIRRPISSSSTDDYTNNKIEIDSDNIETPPSTRRQLASTIDQSATAAAASTLDKTSLAAAVTPCRKLQAPRPLHKKTIEENNARMEHQQMDQQTEQCEPENLGDGQFDRYSAARRTRRYKRPTDHSSSGAEDKNSATSSPEAAQSDSKQQDNLDLDSITLPKIEDKDARLKRWQERLKNLDSEDPTKQSTVLKVISRVGKVGRNLSSINQEDVREAIRNLKSPTETPERVWSPPREIIKEKNVPTKSSQHELNDEGFEETQSLVSDTPSHGKDSTSSCNEQVDSKAPTANATSTSRIRALRMTSSDSAVTTGSETSKKKTTSSVSKPYVQSLLERNRQSLERSRSLRIASSSATPLPRTSVVPKRTNSLRKQDSQGSVTKAGRDVERSGSRTSLRSSRSSLNSAASTNTVRNVVAQKSPRALTLEKSIYKKPLITHTPPPQQPVTFTQSLRQTSTAQRMPASRSSSSGSSIGPSIRRPSITAKNSSSSSTIGSSFKENQSSNTISPSKYIPRSASARLSPSSGGGGGMNNHHMTPTQHSVSNNSISTAAAKVTARLSTPTPPTTGKIQSVSNFMRPTAASATKFSGAKGK